MAVVWSSSGPAPYRLPAINPLRSLRLPLFFALLLGFTYAALYAVEAADAGLTSTPTLQWALAAALTATGVFAVQVVRLFVLDVAFLRTQGNRAPGLVHAVVALVLYFVLGLVIAGGVFGQSLTGAIATSAVASVVLGLALQETLGNFFAGIALQIGQPFRIGDVIHSNELRGRVTAFNWRATTIVTENDSRVILPNTLVAQSPVEVFPRHLTTRHQVLVPAPYEVPPQQIASVVERALVDVPGVAERPRPQIRLARFDDSSVGYEVLYWVEDYLRVAQIDALVRERVWYAYSRHGIPIPYPHEVGVPYEPPAMTDEDPVEERARWLDEAALLDPLMPDERRFLAEHSQTLLFSPGETVLRAGEPGDSMFVVYRGRVEVRVPGPDGKLVRVAEIEPGEVVGEMSLLTGEARSADVVALGEVGLIEVRWEQMKRVLDANEALAEALAQKESERLAQRTDAFARAHSEATRPATSVSILQRIHRFFDLGSTPR